jgi:superoxide dismutase, Cu-Zn family
MMESKYGLPLFGAAALALVLAACGPAEPDQKVPDNPSPQTAVPTTPGATPTGSAASGSPGASSAAEGKVSARFEEYSAGATAITYDPQRVPVGAEAEVEVDKEDGGTKVKLKIEGLKPDTAFGSHVHVAACGESPDDAGPHYQDKADPQKPSTDPKYANRQNEVWLDFTTDSKGEGEAESTVGWQLRDGEGQSVVIHAMPTKTEPGKAGTAGDRLACINIRQ